MEKIKVVVICRNMFGNPDYVSYEIKCSEDEYDNKKHYETAIELARADDFDPVIAIDEFDPVAVRSREIADFFLGNPT